MKSTYKSYKNLVERLTNRLDQAEEKYLDFEDKIDELSDSDNNKEKNNE
jgi:hypothetical protein